MKIQLALDRLTKNECFRLVSETLEFIDWIEVGTGVIKEYGMSIVREMKALYPDKLLIADMKTCDAGKHEAEQAFSSGADVVTVMAFSHNKTITEALEAAQKHRKEIMIDLLEIEDRKRVEEINRLGAELFCLHVGKDSQLQGAFAGEGQLDLVAGLSSIRLAIAGGIDEQSIRSLLGKGIQVGIVGGAITKSEDSAEAAKKIWQAVQS